MKDTVKRGVAIISASIALCASIISIYMALKPEETYPYAYIALVDDYYVDTSQVNSQKEFWNRLNELSGNLPFFLYFEHVANQTSQYIPEVFEGDDGLTMYLPLRIMEISPNYEEVDFEKASRLLDFDKDILKDEWMYHKVHFLVDVHIEIPKNDSNHYYVFFESESLSKLSYRTKIYGVFNATLLDAGFGQMVLKLKPTFYDSKIAINTLNEINRP
ncbi:hypothetical protein C4G24_RS23130 [Vibrio parahaemolyticus]|nr:hypothetical protein [Vibrio parahaemolyticus]